MVNSHSVSDVDYLHVYPKIYPAAQPDNSGISIPSILFKKVTSQVSCLLSSKRQTRIWWTTWYLSQAPFSPQIWSSSGYCTFKHACLQTKTVPKYGDQWCASKHSPLLVLCPGLKRREDEHQQSAVWTGKRWELHHGRVCSGCTTQGRKLPLSSSGTTIHLPFPLIQVKEWFLY